MAIVQVKELIEAGVHFGHRASRWNPKMRPYIYGKRNLIHIIDLRETVRGLLRGHRYLSQVVGKGGLVLFVGTKRQAKELVEREAAPVRHALRQRALAGRHPDQLPHHPRPAQAARRTRGHVAAAGENPNRVDMTAYMTSMLTETGKLDLHKAPETAEIRSYTKKMVSTLHRELTKIRRNLQGIREMNRLPDALVVVDPKREHIAVKEAQRMGVATVALIDTDSDPDTVDLPIPGNDDSIRSIELVLAKAADAVLEGKAALGPDNQDRARPAAAAAGRRSRPRPRRLT